MIEIVSLAVNIVNLLLLLAVFGEVLNIRDFLYFKEVLRNESDL